MLKPRSKNVIQRFATGFAAVLLGSAVSTGTIYAAEEESEAIEEIVVTGIRGSMQQSLERKRNADHFVDAITAEDIGAFPDQNLAESLQRISGVAIDRKSGEGAFVSVRGLGPQFVQTTIHGRVAASNVVPGSHDGVGANNTKSRAVGFHSFQSGLVQAVEVHKSPRADHVEGGLGGFVDIQPRRPLDMGKRHATLSLDATKNDLADDTAPGVFAMFSDVLTDNLGLMVSAQWDNRLIRTDSYRGWGHVFRDVKVDGVSMGSGYYPQQINAEVHFQDRDRLNLSSSLQFLPSDNVDMTLDMLYTDITSSETHLNESWRLQQGNSRITAAESITDNGTTIFTKITTSGAGFFVQHNTEEVAAETLNVGLNVKVQVTDNLALNLDASVSETEAPITNRDAMMRNTRTQMSYDKYGSGGLPSMTTTSPISSEDHFSVVKQSIQSHIVDDKNSQFRLDLTYDHDGDWLKTVQVGARTYRQERRDRSRYLNSKAWINKPIQDFGGGVSHAAGPNWMSSSLGINVPTGGMLPNYAFLQNALETRPDEVRAGKGFNTGSGRSIDEYNSGKFNEDLNHEDDGNAIYAMIAFGGELEGTPYSGNIGVRHVSNSTGSNGELTVPVSVDYSDPSDPTVILSTPEYVDIYHDYTRTLPSLNLRFDPTDELIVRFSVAKVMSRPRYLDLSPRLTVQARPRTMRGGNGKLDPTLGTQVDLAVEWYFADYSLLSLGLFSKDIESFVQPEQTLTPFPGVLDPETQQPLVLNAFRPLNTGKSGIAGMEVSFQRTFAGILPAPFDGLGVIANWTYIDSSSDFQNDNTAQAYGVPGLSEHTINLSVFYEKGPWNGRLSFNSRDDFLDVIADGQGNPSFIDKYSQWDASLNYSVNDNFTVTLQAINITDEDISHYNLLGQSTLSHYVNGAYSGRRSLVGIRWRL
jgi:TonB-dependent receptor